MLRGDGILEGLHVWCSLYGNAFVHVVRVIPEDFHCAVEAKGTCSDFEGLSISIFGFIQCRIPSPPKRRDTYRLALATTTFIFFTLAGMGNLSTLRAILISVDLNLEYRIVSYHKM